MSKTVLITGASGGIGKALANCFARDGYRIILVARDSTGLSTVADELKAKYPIETITITKDLATSTAAQELFTEVTNRNLTVDVLVNNAGFGSFGPFLTGDIKRDEQMMQLNMVTLTLLTKLFVPGMIARKYGKILNVASIAAFLPGPLMAVYYATKAYVLSFSQALGEELKNTGVTVTALCPGPTASGFQKAASQENSSLVAGKKLPTSEEVAEYGYMALMRGTPVAIHGWNRKFMIFLLRFAPRRLVTAGVLKMQEVRKG